LDGNVLAALKEYDEDAVEEKQVRSQAALPETSHLRLVSSQQFTIGLFHGNLDSGLFGDISVGRFNGR